MGCTPFLTLTVQKIHCFFGPQKWTRKKSARITHRKNCLETHQSSSTYSYRPTPQPYSQSNSYSTHEVIWQEIHWLSCLKILLAIGSQRHQTQCLWFSELWKLQKTDFHRSKYQKRKDEICPFSSLAFLQPTTVDKEPKNRPTGRFFFMS